MKTTIIIIFLALSFNCFSQTDSINLKSKYPEALLSVKEGSVEFYKKAITDLLITNNKEMTTENVIDVTSDLLNIYYLGFKDLSNQFLEKDSLLYIEKKKTERLLKENEELKNKK